MKAKRFKSLAKARKVARVLGMRVGKHHRTKMRDGTKGFLVQFKKVKKKRR